MKHLLFLSTFLSVLLFYQSNAFGQFEYPTPIEMEQIQVGDIFTEGSNKAGDAIIETTSINTLLPTPFLTTTVTRKVTNLWRIVILDTDNENDLSVTYNLLSDKGTQKTLSNGNNSDEIKVDITPINPLIVVNYNSVNKTKTVQGGAIFTLNLSDIKTSGSYSGKLRVTITRI